MNYTLYSTEGCARCKILKARMAELGLGYEEYDFKGEGKEAFQKFYAANRKSIYRGAEGVEFPVLTDGTAIKQGVGAALAYLEGGTAMDGFFRIGVLRKEWLDGIDLSGGSAGQSETVLRVLRFLKQNAMKMVIETNGKNPALLETVLAEELAAKIIMNVLGPQEMYSALAGERIEPQDVERSIALAAQFGACQFQTVVVPVRRSPEVINYMTPEEIGAAAKWIETATGSKKQPYLIKFYRQSAADAAELKELAPLAPNQFFPYRTAARAYQVSVEIEKEPTGSLGQPGRLPCV